MKFFKHLKEQNWMAFAKTTATNFSSQKRAFCHISAYFCPKNLFRAKN